MPRSSRPISVTLGALQKRVDARVKSGEFESASEVLRAAVKALDREDVALRDWMRSKIDEALNDPRPDIPADEVFARLRDHHQKRLRAKQKKRAA
jgi:antitoxin ParD1/3/4